MKSRILVLLGTCATATRLFRWDVQELESVFCVNSKKAFTDLNMNTQSKIEASEGMDRIFFFFLSKRPHLFYKDDFIHNQRLKSVSSLLIVFEREVVFNLM